MFLDWKNQYCQSDHTTQGNLQIQCNFYQITNGIFHRIRTKNFKVCMETQKTLNSQSNLEKEKQELEESGSLPSTMLQSYSNQNSMVLAQKQKYRSVEQDRKPRNKPTHLWSINLQQGFPGCAVVKNPPANAGDTGLSPGPGRSHMPQSS